MEETSSTQKYRPGVNWLESSSAEKDLQSPGWQQVKDESARALAAKVANCILVYTRKSVASQSKEAILPPYAVFFSLRTKYHTQFQGPQYKKDAVRLEQVQWSANKIRDWSTQQ